MNENKVLKWMTLITSTGDFFTLFAIIQITQNLFGNTWVSASNIIIQSAAICLSGIITPKILYKAKPRPIFLVTQFGSAIAITYLFVSLHFNLIKSPWPLYVVLFIVTYMWYLFSAARESLSKGLTTHDKEHQNMQSELLSGFYSAQFLGPIIAVAFILKFGPRIPLLMDALSFIFCGFLSFKIKGHVIYEEKMHILRPFKYLLKKPDLLKVVFLRNVAFWVSFGVFNYVFFKLVEESFVGILPEGKEIMGSAFMYSLVGFGALLGTLLIRYKVTNLYKLENHQLAFLSCVLYGISMIAMAYTRSFLPILILNFILAVGIGFSALSTQTMRRLFSNHSEFAEIIALDSVLNRAIEWIFGSLTAIAILKYGMDTNSLLIISGIFAIIAGFGYLTYKTNASTGVELA